MKLVQLHYGFVELSFSMVMELIVLELSPSAAMELVVVQNTLYRI